MLRATALDLVKYYEPLRRMCPALWHCADFGLCFRPKRRNQLQIRFESGVAELELKGAKNFWLESELKL